MTISKGRCRVLSLALLLCLFISMLTITAFADPETDPAETSPEVTNTPPAVTTTPPPVTPTPDSSGSSSGGAESSGGTTTPEVTAAPESSGGSGSTSPSAKEITKVQVRTNPNRDPLWKESASSYSAQISYGEGTEVGSISWTVASSGAAADTFQMDVVYTCRVTVKAKSGYVFASRVTGVLNNTVVSCERVNDSTVVLSYNVKPAAWAPTIVKQPTEESGLKVGDTVSFAASATDYETVQWYVRMAPGTVVYKAEDLGSHYPGVYVTFVANGNTVNIHNLTADFHKAAVYATYSNAAGYRETWGALIKMDLSATPVPTTTPAPTPTPEVTATPAPAETGTEPAATEAPAADGSGEAASAGTETVACVHQYIPGEWKSDESGHWQVCTLCGEDSAHTAHISTDGKCDICGYGDSAAQPAKDSDSKVKLVVGIGLGLAGLLGIVAIVLAVAENNKRKRSRHSRKR